MKEVIAVFEMKNISDDTKIKVLRKLGRALNDEYAMNWTGEIIDELVDILEAKN
tara:strand:+ start:410 stop:571 length:162 start_codon:yes stop_codon:yes gene_type:complete